jgi:hypothetical protein
VLLRRVEGAHRPHLQGQAVALADTATPEDQGMRYSETPITLYRSTRRNVPECLSLGRRDIHCCLVLAATSDWPLAGHESDWLCNALDCVYCSVRTVSLNAIQEFSSLGRAMSQAVIRHSVTAEAAVRSQVSPRAICGG